jgi:hypothetical protein
MVGNRRFPSKETLLDHAIITKSLRDEVAEKESYLYGKGYSKEGPVWFGWALQTFFKLYLQHYQIPRAALSMK